MADFNDIIKALPYNKIIHPNGVVTFDLSPLNITFDFFKKSDDYFIKGSSMNGNNFHSYIQSHRPLEETIRIIRNIIINHCHVIYEKIIKDKEDVIQFIEMNYENNSFQFIVANQISKIVRSNQEKSEMILLCLNAFKKEKQNIYKALSVISTDIKIKNYVFRPSKYHTTVDFHIEGKLK